MMGPPGMWGAGGWTFMILFWILIVIVIAYLVKELTDGGKDNTGDRSGKQNKEALTILDERYARGEIDEEEYRKKKRNLQGD